MICARIGAPCVEYESGLCKTTIGTVSCTNLLVDRFSAIVDRTFNSLQKCSSDSNSPESGNNTKVCVCNAGHSRFDGLPKDSLHEHPKTTL